MPTTAKPSIIQVLSKLTSIVLCALCLQFLCGCASKSGDEGVVEHTLRYANARIMLDMAVSCVVGHTPDAKVDLTVVSFKETPSGEKEIRIEPAVISDTMASWGTDEWAANRDDLFFNIAAHLNVACKQAHEYGDVPENYVVTCPDYMVVYDSQKSTGFVVTSTGVYQKTDDSENPIGEPIVVTSIS